MNDRVIYFNIIKNLFLIILNNTLMLFVYISKVKTLKVFIFVKNTW